MTSARDLLLNILTRTDGRGAEKAAQDLDRLASEVDKVSGKSRAMAVDTSRLDDEIAHLTKRGRDLREELARTGDKGLLRDIAGNDRMVSRLSKVRQELEGLGDSAAKVGPEIEKGLLASIDAGGPSVPMAIAGLVVSPPGLALASVAGAQFGGALLAGIGLAGIGVGIAAEMKNPAIASAVSGLKTQISAGLTDAAQPFVAPLEGALQHLGVTFHDLEPGLHDMFSTLAPTITTLEHGVSAFAEAVAPAIERAASAAKPLLDDIGNSYLPELGKSVGEVFDTISAHAPEARAGLKMLFSEVDTGVKFVGVAIDVLSFLFDKAMTFEAGLLTTARDVVGAADAVAKFLHLPHDDLDKVHTALEASAKGANALNDKLNGSQLSFAHTASAANGLGDALTYDAIAEANAKAKYDDLTKAIGKDQAINQAKDTIAAITDVIKANGDTLDQNTAKGRKNREAYERSIMTLKDQRDALIADGMSAGDANKAFAGWVKALDKAMEKAGLSKKDIEKLNEALGLDITKHVKLVVSASGGGARLIKRAAGGPFEAHQTMLVGEQGPEIVEFDRPGKVIPNNKLGRAGGGGIGGGGVTIQNLHLTAYSDRFSLAQVQRELALYGAH